MSSSSTPQPPVPFSDFEFSFDPALSTLFPHPPPLPSSADLFSPSETTDLLGFLDNFNWEFDGIEQPANDGRKSIPPFSSQDPSNTRPKHATMLTDDQSALIDTRDSRSNASNSSSSTACPSTPPPIPSPSQPPQPRQASSSSVSERSVETSRAKPLLSTPQKRLNHIMSEQKRRNAIRDGYAQLIALLAPAGAEPGLGMPTRGRPKGSGSRGKGKSKGKSGVLFRAAEYCRWLEEGRDALRDEVLRVEAAAGIQEKY